MKKRSLVLLVALYVVIAMSLSVFILPVRAVDFDVKPLTDFIDAVTESIGRLIQLFQELLGQLFEGVI